MRYSAYLFRCLHLLINSEPLFSTLFPLYMTLFLVFHLDSGVIFFYLVGIVVYFCDDVAHLISQYFFCVICAIFKSKRFGLVLESIFEQLFCCSTFSAKLS